VEKGKSKSSRQSHLKSGIGGAAFQLAEKLISVEGDGLPRRSEH
jgi:hypothetical protein